MNEIFDRGSAVPKFVIAFVLGDAAVQQLPELPSAAAIFLIAILGVFFLQRRFILPAGFCLGVGWAACFALNRGSEVLPLDLERSEFVIEGRIASLPERAGKETRFEFQVKRVISPEGRAIPDRIRLTWYDRDVMLKAGEGWRLAVKLKRPRGMMNPGGMDYELWLFSRNIRATGYVRDRPENLPIAAAGRWDVQVWRQALHDRLSAVLGDSPFAGIIQALVLGADEDITPDQWTVLRRTGTAHLVAISGSHIGLITAGCFFLVRRAASSLGMLRYSPPTLAAAAAFAVAVFYAALADFSIPTQRALIMIAVVMGGVIGRRNLRPFHTLLVALFAVTAYDPLAVLAPGFWLSFGAVALIAYGVSCRLGTYGVFGNLWRINWITALGLAPLLLWFFQQVPLISPLANLFAVPLIGLVVTPMCLLGAILLWLSSTAAAWIFQAASLLLNGGWLVLEWLSGLSAAQWVQPRPPFWTLPFALTGALLLLAPRGVPGRWLGLVLFLPALSVRPERPSEGEFRLTLLDVGQGLAAVIETQDHTLVFDTGARFSGRFDMGAAVIEPFLRSRGVARADVLVISHGDNDHIGGAASLYRLMPVGLTYSSVPERLPMARAVSCRAGQDWRWDGVRFEFLSPIGSEGGENDRSCVLKVSARDLGVLLPGDIERPAEEDLVRRYGERLSSAVLIAPHHGSKTSSSSAFLAEVRPRYVLIPAGHLNRYGFPHASVLRRYQDAGARIFSTAEEGAIAVEVSGSRDVSKPAGYRTARRRYWNAESNADPEASP